MDRDIKIKNNNEELLETISKHYGLEIIDATSVSTVLNYQLIKKYVKNGLFIYMDSNATEFIAINNSSIIFSLLDTTLEANRTMRTIPQTLQDLFKSLGVKDNIIHSSKIKLIKNQNFYLVLERNFSHLNIIKAKYWLKFISLTPTTKNINFLKATIYFHLLFFFSLLQLPIFFHLLNNVGYFIQNILKIFLFKRALIDVNSEILNVTHNELPIYTILVPLYQEATKLESIIKSLVHLNYPKDKLDIKIIIESDDHSLINALTDYSFPSYIHVIIVPFSIPRTKPKALNYAITYAKGEYIAIYDAEDKPEVDQLIKVVATFQQLPAEYACIQAKLNFYNSDENLLTKLLSIEYAIWFEYLLKGLSLFNLPVPLGGTSNHFKADILDKLGFWDAYNVTEDAELGIRLYAHGYKTHIIDSYTFEEAPVTVNNWMNQRARWIKGFIQTFVVFFTYKEKRRNFNWLQIIVIYIFIGVSTYSFYCLPWLIITIITNTNPIIDYLWLINSFFALSYSYSTAWYALNYTKDKLAYQKSFLLLDYLGLILWPFYFILHSAASYKALWEIITKPFSWNKTQHGVSTYEIDKNIV